MKVIIIGAGGAGLMAARQLSEEGVAVTVLEASSVAGGRIQTLKEEGFSMPAEAGAEFVHGLLPVTLGLLQEAGIEFNAIAGDMRTVRGGKWLTDDPMDKHWEELMDRMNGLKEDMTVDEFVKAYFDDPKYATLRDSITRFAEGFDLADTSKVSVLSLKEEWAGEFEDDQYRVSGGYSVLIDYLVKCCVEKNVQFHFSTPAERIAWSANNVTVHSGEKTFTGNKVLVSVPVSVMNAGKIRFDPEAQAAMLAFKDIGYGTVIKFLLEFREEFWKKQLGDAGFVLSDEAVPTWWTQGPDDSKLLSGWLGGPSVLQYSSITEEELLTRALRSLANIFQLTEENIRGLLVHSKIINWTQNPFSLGGYSYSTPASKAARGILNIPIEGTIFFTGEALYTGDAPGTVEAALVAGQESAIRILGS